MLKGFWPSFDRSPLPETAPIRGVWIANRPHSQVLASPENIRQALAFIREIGLNTIFPVVWNRGYTLFPSQVMLDRGFPPIDPFFAENAFDPLQIITKYARELQLNIIPWFEYGFAASPLATGGHILSAYPHWWAIDACGQGVKQGGLCWMNALDRAVQDFLLGLVAEVASNYDIDGVQGCDRLPALPVEAGYNAQTIQDYQRDINTKITPYPSDPHWIQWRSTKLSDWLASLYQQMKAIDPRLIVSLSPAVYPFCRDHLLQDPGQWIDRHLVDYLHPQIYRQNFSAYQAEAKKQKAYLTKDNRVKIAPGIALTANGIDLSLQDIQKMRHCHQRLGFNGEVFFHYEGLRKNGDRVAIALQSSYSNGQGH